MAGGVLAVLFVVAQIVVWGGAGFGVVREHCLELETSTATQPDLDSKWTYVLWPPSFLANLDPPGTCVRNSPLHEGLSELGVWELPPPGEQVREHIVEQLRDG